MASGLLCEEQVDFPDVAHTPVLLREAVELVRPRPGAVLVDCTVGQGGHAEALLDASGPDGVLVGVDRDRQALVAAGRRLARFGSRFRPVHGDHRELPALLRTEGIFALDGILADLGVSSAQLDDPSRGFSFRHDGPLDMRMDRSGGPTAADLLAEIPESELRRILREYGEERRAGPIARAIVRERERAPLETTSRLAEVVARAAGPAARRFRIHPATRTFQALRIAVNGEISGLDRFVSDAVALLRRGGRIAVISFHSLEDRAIKHALRALAERCVCPPGLPVCGCGRENIVRLLTSRAVVPGSEELERNPRARSARLRAAERT